MASRSAIDERPYVSTGHLPNPEMVQSLVEDAHRHLKSNVNGKNSQVYPTLARVPSELFGVRVVATNGQVYDDEFSIMSVSKPFVFALICEMIGLGSFRAMRQRANAGDPPDAQSDRLLLKSRRIT